MSNNCASITKCSEKKFIDKKRTYLSRDEVDKLAKACVLLPRLVDRNRLIIYTLFWFGLRVSELIRLRWSDFDFERNTINVIRQKGSLNSLQVMPCTRYVRMLRSYKIQCEKNGHLDHVFLTQHGTPLSRLTIHHMIRDAADCAGFRFHVYPHMLRHSLGYFLANHGIATRDIQMHLGHKNIMNTVRYTEVDTSVFSRTWDRMGVR